MRIVAQSLLFAAIATTGCGQQSPTAADFAAQRQRMVEQQLKPRGIKDERVLAAMAKMPREEFVPADERGDAYEDGPLPIGFDQTISQPYIVALMLEVLKLEPSAKVLEVGTGSGYMTALLAELAAQVYSVERHGRLARQAEDTLVRLGYHTVTVLVGDGTQGLSDFAPYDGIVVSAAASQIPAALIDQLLVDPNLAAQIVRAIESRR